MPVITDNLHGGDHKSTGKTCRLNAEAGAIGGASKGKTCPCSADDTAFRLAREHGVSPRTIRNDGAFAAAVEKLTPDHQLHGGRL